MDAFVKFLSDMKVSTRYGTLVESVEDIYRGVFESGIGFKAIPPDAMHSTAVMQTGTGIKCPVGTSAGSVGGPNVAGAYKYSPALAGPTRDMKEETDEAFATKPKMPTLQTYTTRSIKKLIDNSPSQRVGGVEMDPSTMASEPTVGFTVKSGAFGNTSTINGVDASGGGGGGSGASAEG